MSTRQLAACGLDSGAITARVRRGHLHRIHRGVYAVGAGVLTLKGELAAAALACGDGAVLSDHAAAAWWEMFAWDGRHPGGDVPHDAGRRRSGIRPRWSSSLDARDVWRRDNILVPHPHARRSISLRRCLRAGPASHGPQALAERRVSVRQLTEVLDRSAGHRGAAALGVLLAAGPVATRSELEDLALELLDQAGIDAPRSTPELVLDGRRIRPDLLWRRQRLVVELDGGAWHDDKLTRENDGVRRRSSRRTATRVLRITWHQLVDDPRQTLARIRAALADAG